MLGESLDLKRRHLKRKLNLANSIRRSPSWFPLNLFFFVYVQFLDKMFLFSLMVKRTGGLTT